MIALYSSAFDYLMKKVAQHQKAEQTPAMMMVSKFLLLLVMMIVMMTNQV